MKDEKIDFKEDAITPKRENSEQYQQEGSALIGKRVKIKKPNQKNQIQ